MQLRFVLFSLACLSGAVYLGATRGAFDVATLGVGVTAIGGFAAARLSGPPTQKRSEHSVSAPRTRALQEQVATLAANLEALADSRAGVDSEFAGRGQLAVRLVSVGQNQIALIKTLRSHLQIGLKEAKDLTDEAKRGGRPLLDKALAAEAARSLARDVAAAGGRVEFE